MGPGKMANFAYKLALAVIRGRLTKTAIEYPQPLVEDAQQTTSSFQLYNFVQQSHRDEDTPEAAPALVVHTPNSSLTRYACRRCRTVLFGIEDQEDPPHRQSLHDFRKKRQKVGYGNAGPCQNYFIAQPLPWMDDGCSDVEGKLHCPKCKTKVGHYSWTGAQCSCGTWVTPAIMIPLSKVDEMKPIVAGGPHFCHTSSSQGEMVGSNTVLLTELSDMDVSDL